MPQNCVRENSLWLCGYGVGFCPGVLGPYPVQSLYFCYASVNLFVTDFIRKMGTRTGLAIQPNCSSKMEFLPNKASSH